MMRCELRSQYNWSIYYFLLFVQSELIFFNIIGSSLSSLKNYRTIKPMVPFLLNHVKIEGSQIQTAQESVNSEFTDMAEHLPL